VKRLFVLVLLCAAAAWPQVAANANRAYQTKEGRESIAKRLSDAHRDQAQHPRDLVEAMSLRPGSTVADVGTGTGYMLPYLSKAVGVGGHVVAEDIFPDFLDRARMTARNQSLTNVRFIEGTDQDPKLPGESIDAVLVLDAYHHFDYPETMLGHIRDSLFKAGRLYIVDYYKRPTAMPGGDAVQHIRLDEEDVVREVEANGFHLVSQREINPGSQYMLIFEKR
jgi:ubiquinone/menaquinone biosynthesis C-methylase UbiE